MSIISEMVKNLKRSSKEDYIPGTVAGILERTCPICSPDVHLAQMNPCCGSAKGYIWCKKCNYKEQIL